MAPWPEQGNEPKAPDKTSVKSGDNTSSDAAKSKSGTEEDPQIKGAACKSEVKPGQKDVDAEKCESASSLSKALCDETENCLGNRRPTSKHISKEEGDIDVCKLDHYRLKDLLDEAYHYDGRTDHKSTELFKQLLVKAKEDLDPVEFVGTFSNCITKESGTKGKRRKKSASTTVAERQTRGGSLQDLDQACELEGVATGGVRKKRNRREGGGVSVSARQREGGSLPSHVGGGTLTLRGYEQNLSIDSTNRQQSAGKHKSSVTMPAQINIEVNPQPITVLSQLQSVGNCGGATNCVAAVPDQTVIDMDDGCSNAISQESRLSKSDSVSSVVTVVSSVKSVKSETGQSSSASNAVELLGSNLPNEISATSSIVLKGDAKDDSVRDTEMKVLSTYSKIDETSPLLTSVVSTAKESLELGGGSRSGRSVSTTYTTFSQRHHSDVDNTVSFPLQVKAQLGDEHPLQLDSSYSSVVSLTNSKDDMKDLNRASHHQLRETGNESKMKIKKLRCGVNDGKEMKIPLDENGNSVNQSHHIETVRPFYQHSARVDSINNNSNEMYKKRKKRPNYDRNATTMYAKEIQGFCGDKDIEYLLHFIETDKSGKDGKPGKGPLHFERNNRKNRVKRELIKDSSGEWRSSGAKETKTRGKNGEVENEGRKKRFQEQTKLKKSSSMEEVSKSKLEDVCTSNVLRRQPTADAVLGGEQYDEGVSDIKDGSCDGESVSESGGMASGNDYWADVRCGLHVKTGGSVVSLGDTPVQTEEDWDVKESTRRIVATAPSSVKDYNGIDTITDTASSQQESNFSSFAADFYAVADPGTQVLEETEFHLVTKKQRKKKKHGSHSSSSSTHQIFVNENNRVGNGRSYTHYIEGGSSGSNAAYTSKKTFKFGNAYQRPSKDEEDDDDVTHYCHHNRHNDVMFLSLAAHRQRSGDRRKSTSSVPPSDHSESSDVDSVHSLPVSSTTPKPTVNKVSTSSGSTPQASYADIARIASNTAHVNTCTILAMSQKLKTPEISSFVQHASTSPAVLSYSTKTVNTVTPVMPIDKQKKISQGTSTSVNFLVTSVVPPSITSPSDFPPPAWPSVTSCTSLNTSSANGNKSISVSSQTVNEFTKKDATTSTTLDCGSNPSVPPPEVKHIVNIEEKQDNSLLEQHHPSLGENVGPKNINDSAVTITKTKAINTIVSTGSDVSASGINKNKQKPANVKEQVWTEDLVSTSSSLSSSSSSYMDFSPPLASPNGSDENNKKLPSLSLTSLVNGVATASAVADNNVNSASLKSSSVENCVNKKVVTGKKSKSQGAINSSEMTECTLETSGSVATDTLSSSDQKKVSSTSSINNNNVKPKAVKKYPSTSSASVLSSSVNFSVSFSNNNCNLGEHVSLPAVIILDKQGCVVSGEGEASDFTFGFDINEQLLAMTGSEAEVNSVDLSTNDNTILTSSCTRPLSTEVTRQNVNDSNYLESSVVMRPEGADKDFTSMYKENKNTLDKNSFNYDQIVTYVGEAWDSVLKQLGTAGPMTTVQYYQETD